MLLERVFVLHSIIQYEWQLGFLRLFWLYKALMCLKSLTKTGGRAILHFVKIRVNF
jgi:hypothetical protein